ncbi:MAG: 50S ribosomal protein L25/general stress protein Ctc [Rickettsiales bacterium]|jgi:large subunit ribosomal protein L25|nr:50S ribosomal protein L25/general stress protein Ctc [Rickettsiales bacterium]
MSNKVELKVEKRENSGKGAARKIRKNGLIPAVVYGNKEPPELIAVTPKDLQKQMQAKGFRTRQFELAVGAKKELALCQHIQYDRVTDMPVHVDFLRIDPNKELSVEIPFAFIGEDKSAGIKKGGVLNIVAREASVICKPSDIVDEIVIDVSGLDISESIHSGSVSLPAGLRFEEHEEFTIATIAAPVEEVVEEAPAADAASVPTEGDLKKEEAAKAEGAKDSKEAK